MSETPLKVVGQDVARQHDALPDPTGKTPYEVMIANMAWYDGQAERLLRQVERLIVKAGDPRSRAEAEDTLRQFFAMRDKSQACARDAAPYAHGHLRPTNQSPLPPGAREPRSSTYDLPEDDLEQATKAYLRLMG